MTTETNHQPALETAAVILAKLGGQEFAAATGAKNFAAGDASLSFGIPSTTEDGINLVKITATPWDMFTVSFYRHENNEQTLIAHRTGVYGDFLKATFAAVTGLACAS